MNRSDFLKTGALETLDVAGQAIVNNQSLILSAPTPTETLCANLSMSQLIFS